jgi:hypothetical protein
VSHQPGICPIAAPENNGACKRRHAASHALALAQACAGSSANRNGGVLHKLTKTSKIMMNTVFNPFFLFMRKSPFMIRVRFIP